MAEPLDCQDLVELVSDYIDHALSAPERGRFEEHLAECDGCITYIEQMRTTIRLTGTLSVEDVEPDAMTDLLAAFHRLTRSR